MDGFERKPTLVTERLIIRPMRADDAAALLAATEDPEARRLTGTHRRFTLGELDVWCASRGEQQDRLDLVIEDRITGEWLGDVAVLDWDHDNRSCAIRVALVGEARGRGFGTEAIRAVLAHVFSATPAHRVSLDVYAFNVRAIATYERLGFAREGVLRDALRWDGEYVDAIVMSVLRPEWDSRACP